jgi:hypothetical protein
MADKAKAQKTMPRGIDPKTGKPYEDTDIAAPKRSALFAAVRRMARDAVVRRTSTKG